jgi:hypothetical protein
MGQCCANEQNTMLNNLERENLMTMWDDSIKHGIVRKKGK